MVKNLAPGISMTRIAPSSIVPVITKRIIISILRITVLHPSSIVGGKFGAVVWRNKRLIESMPVCTRRGSLGRREVLVVSATVRLL